MKAKVKVDLNSGAVKRLERAKQQAFEMTVEAVLSDIKTSAVVPKDTGMLEDSGLTRVDVESMVASIVFDTPYARKLYWHPEYNFRTDKNANAGGLWMDTYIRGDKKDFVKNTFMKFFKQLSGGIIQ